MCYIERTCVHVHVWVCVPLCTHEYLSHCVRTHEYTVVHTLTGGRAHAHKLLSWSVHYTPEILIAKQFLIMPLHGCYWLGYRYGHVQQEKLMLIITQCHAIILFGYTTYRLLLIGLHWAHIFSSYAHIFWMYDHNLVMVHKSTGRGTHSCMASGYRNHYKIELKLIEAISRKCACAQCKPWFQAMDECNDSTYIPQHNIIVNYECFTLI